MGTMIKSNRKPVETSFIIIFDGLKDQNFKWRDLDD